MAKRASGEGSIFQRADGRWCAAVFALDAEGRRKRTFLYASTQQAVLEKLEESRARVRQRVAEPDRRRTVGGYFRDWASGREVRERTRASYEWIVAKHIVPVLGEDLRLIDLTARHVAELLAQKRHAGLAPRTRRYILTIVRMALEAAVRERLLVRNVARDVETPRVEAFEVAPLSIEETRRFVAGLRGDRDEAALRLAAVKGLRLGELLALRWQDLDLDGAKPRVRIEHTLCRRYRKRGKGKPAELEATATSMVQPPAWSLAPVKSKASRRTLALPGSVVEALRRRRAFQAEERLLAGPEWDDRGFVFTGPFGAPLDASALRRRFKRILAKAKLRPVRVHDLRHGAATMLLLQGENLKQVSASLGHSRIATTADIYAHFVEEADREAADRLDAALETPPAAAPKA